MSSLQFRGGPLGRPDVKFEGWTAGSTNVRLHEGAEMYGKLLYQI
ncbi:WSSV191 [White spot syndrome virus]|uniref:WSSV191 n=1 Tax=White spot syndrome virus TaxID=342409 RepID=A0A2I6SBS1_9VIRU|nr:WSSV191 [White spot syndrome virus]